jgi:hypothetical protein
MHLRLVLGNGIEQCVCPPEQVISLIHVAAANAGWIDRNEHALAVLTHELLAEILYADLEASTAGRASLDEVGGV